MNLVATSCDVRELRASQVLSKWESQGRTTGRCRGVMFMDVEHEKPGEGVGLGTATGTWGFRYRCLVHPRRMMKHDVRLRAGGRTRRCGIWGRPRGHD